MTGTVTGRVAVETDIEPLAREWDELADRTGAGASVRPGWVAAWWRAFGTGRLHVVTVRRDGRLAALVPLHRPALRARAFTTEPLPLTARPGTLRATANWYTPRFGFLADDAGAASELAAGVLRERPPLVSLAFLDTDDPAALAWREHAVAAGYRLHEVGLPPSPYVEVVGRWSCFEASLSPRLRRDLRRRERRLAEHGVVELTVGGDPHEVDELLDEGLQVEPSGWKAARGSAVVSRPETRRFYGDVARWAATRGILRLAFLRVAGRPVAFQYGLEEGGTYSFLKGGYDPDYERYAPGKLLVHRMLERAFTTGLRRFDFQGGDEPWKLEWTRTCRERYVVHASSPDLRGTLEHLAVAYGRPARAAVRARAKAWVGH